jgi:hypothetical protein
MALLAMAIPILPGMKEKWQKEIIENFTMTNKAETDSLREEAGVHERTFVQETPNGDFVILTFEDDDPAAGNVGGCRRDPWLRHGRPAAAIADTGL